MLKNKEYFFLLDLIKPISKEVNVDVEFINQIDKDRQPKCIKTKEESSKIVKIFKFSHNPTIFQKDSFEFEFLFEGKKYQLIIKNTKDKTFIFDVSLQMYNKELDQGKISQSEKMTYFYEALVNKNENNYLNTLYLDSIDHCKKKPSFDFLINIFVKVNNTDLCQRILGLFSQNAAKFVETINKENLEKYKFDIDQICENIDNKISEFSLNQIGLYGLILCYFNICNKEKYQQLFDKLSENQNTENILLEALLKYKIFFKNKNDMNKETLTRIIKFATKKEFHEFLEIAYFYLKDINTFLELIEENKEDIFKIKGFESIEIPEIKDDEEIKFGIVNPKIEKITEFSKEQKKILVILKGKFWESLAKKCSGVNRDNIDIISTIRTIFNRYYLVVESILPKEDKIAKEIARFFKKGIFTHQIDKLIREYIKTNKKITNSEIIDLIRDYHRYYKEKIYENKREPEILEKIDLEEIDDNFIKKFKEMKFEEL